MNRKMNSHRRLGSTQINTALGFGILLAIVGLCYLLFSHQVGNPVITIEASPSSEVTISPAISSPPSAKSSTPTSSTSSNVSASEKAEIDAWITTSGYNNTGDPMTTQYPGGTPLFDEGTGKKIDRYDYIVGKHPTKPWKK